MLTGQVPAAMQGAPAIRLGATAESLRCGMSSQKILRWRGGKPDSRLLPRSPQRRIGPPPGLGTARSVPTANRSWRLPAQLLLMAFQAKRAAGVCNPQQFRWCTGGVVVYIVAGRALQHARIKRYACYNRFPVDRWSDETAVRSRQGRIVSKADRVVIGQTTRGCAQGCASQVRSGGDRGGSSRLAAEVVNRYGAVVTGQAKLGDRTDGGLSQSGIQRWARIHGVCCRGCTVVPQQRATGRVVRRVADDADLACAVPRLSRKIVRAAGDASHRALRGEKHYHRPRGRD